MAVYKKKWTYLLDGNIDFDAWFTYIQQEYSLITIDTIKKATELAAHSTKGLTTFYGQPCIEQSLEMAEIMLDLHLDQDAIAASILVSPITHTQLDIETIKSKINDATAKLLVGVRELNILNTVQPKKRDSLQIDRLRKTFLAMASDVRVAIIKLAEQMCIMRGIKQINKVERQAYAEETLDIYAPLANKLGIGQLKWELEDIAFHYKNPETYKMIAHHLSERRVDRETRIKNVIDILKTEFTNNHMKFDFSGRAKHIYSIYLKMQKKHLDIKNIYDASAIRILVPTIDDCYTALSIVHSIWEHVNEEYDDYIAKPKPNGYRSIHTAVVMPDGKHLEIQIRTYAMHEEAEHGVAAHWIYKEKNVSEEQENKITFLRQLLAWHKELANDSAPEQLSLTFDDRIYVLTPRGDIIELPKGATPLDCAYSIHTEVGHRCRGAKVNGHIVQLTHELQTGDRIEIITTQAGTPSRDWLNKDSGYLKTARARAKVAQWFRQQDVNQHIETGRQLLEREFTRAGVHHFDFQKMATHFSYKTVDGFLTAVAHGTVKPSQILHTMQISTHEIKPVPAHSARKISRPSTGFQIDGVGDLLARIARCCKPIPGDEIIGFITQGRGVSIHRKNCRNVSDLSADNQNRLIKVSWDNQHPSTYYVDLQIRAMGRDQLLKEITSLLANLKIDVVSFNSTINKKNNFNFINLTVQIRDNKELQTLIQELNQLPYVNEVKRIN